MSHCPRLAKLEICCGTLLPEAWPHLSALTELNLLYALHSQLAGMGLQGTLPRLRTLTVEDQTTWYDMRSGWRAECGERSIEEQMEDDDDVGERVPEPDFDSDLVCGLADRLPALRFLDLPVEDPQVVTKEASEASL